MKIITAIDSKSEGGAQAVSRAMLNALSSCHHVDEYSVFRKCDYKYSFFYKWFLVVVRALNNIRAAKPEVVISHLDTSLFVFSLLKPLFKYKLVHVYHGPPTVFYGKNLLYECVKKRAVSCVDGNIFVSSEQRNYHEIEYPEILKGISVVIYNPFIIKAVPLEAALKNFVFRVHEANGSVWLLVGRLSKQKNQMFALRVLQKWLEQGGKAVLLLAGKGEDYDYLHSMVKKYGMKSNDSFNGDFSLDHNVIFLGHRNDVQSLMREVDVVLMPSLYEGFPLAMVEAACRGVRIVASNCETGPSEILKICNDAVGTKQDKFKTIHLLPADFEDSQVCMWTSSIAEVLKEDKMEQRSYELISEIFSSKQYNEYVLSFIRSINYT
ncbi:glycosyltransferase [Halomonas sp. RA08-2]|uniref:glycosyltransferase n=1 Tax=Halomonas sp. RA08-2 TaxID=3440842 RepID=UPI003EEE2426